MSAPGPPVPEPREVFHDAWRDAILRRWAAIPCQRPRTVLLIAVALALVCGVITARYMGFQSDRSRLVSEDLPWNARYLNYKDLFPHWNDILIVMDGPSDARQSFALRVADRLREAPEMVSVLDGYRVLPHHASLLLSAPTEIFNERWDELLKSRPILEAGSLLTLVAGEPSISNTEASQDARTMTPTVPSTSELAQLNEMLARIDAVLNGSQPRMFPEAAMEPWRPLETESGALQFIVVSPETTDTNAISGPGEAIDTARALIAEVQASDPLFEAVGVGVTGIPAIEHDETAQSIRDSTVASALAAILISILMITVFRGVVVPMMAMTALLFGVVWSFGYLTITVGHLQLISVVFTVILLGLGIDFALHLVARLELIRDDHDTLRGAITDVFCGVGPGMITGAITTAAAFGITGFTEFKGVAEMGVIAGGGILLCLTSVLFTFAAMLALHPNWKRSIRVRKDAKLAHFAAGTLDVVHEKPWATLLVVLVVTVSAGLLGQRVRYDPNILNLHPPGIESVEWERRLIDDSEKSAWAGLSLTDSIEEAEHLTLAFLDSPEVASVEGVGVLFHPDRHTRWATVRDAYPGQTTAPSGITPFQQVAPTLSGITRGIAVAHAQAGESLDEAWELEADRAVTSIDVLIDRLGQRDGEVLWSDLEQHFLAERDLLDAQWSAMISRESPSIDDLPEPIHRTSVSPVDGSLLLRVQPTSTGESILSSDRLELFVGAMREIDPDTIGPPIQIYESTRVIIRAYVKAAFLALAAIAVILLLDFHSPLDMLCGLLPVGIGFIGMFGLMGMFDVPLNFANIIVLPLLFGIGVDAGVHMVHRWRLEPGGIPCGLSGGTGRGITLTMMTTMIGFGCMMTAQHRGIRGLGFTMTAGLFVTLLACYAALPPLLRLRGRLSTT